MSVANARRLTGQRLPRREDPKLLAGRGRFVDDVALPRMLHAAFVRSPYAHAEIGGIDPARALALPGVHAVVTGADVRRACAGPMTIETSAPRDEVRTSVQPVLPTDKVRFLGEPVAIVLAESRYVAEDGAELVEVGWRPLEPVLSVEQALADGAPVIQAQIPDNNFAHIEYADGDVEGCFARAAHVFRKRLATGRWAGNPLEPRGVIAAYDRATGDAELWSACQTPHALRSIVSHIVGIPEGRLRCFAPDVGGSFGVKGQIYPEDPALLGAAVVVGRPVKWIEDRVEHLTTAAHSKDMAIDIALALDDDLRFLAFDAHYAGDAGAYAQLPSTPLIDVLMAAVLLPSLYRVEACRYTLDCAFTTKSPGGAARGVGWTSGQMAREALIDEAARELGVDPAELRLRNCIDDEPQRITTGLTLDGGSYRQAIERALELADYPALRRRQEELRAQGRYLGIGVSPFVEPGAFGTLQARVSGIAGASYDSASITVEPDGSVLMRSGFHSHGQGQQTTFAQLVADVLGAPYESVRILQGDTLTGTYGFGTFGSRSAAIAAELITLAAGDVREKLVRCAAHLLGCDADGITLEDGVFRAPDGADTTLHDVAGAVHYGGPEARPPGFEPLLSSTRFFDPPESYTNGAAVAAVEVDVQTGLVEIEHLWFVEDCGVMLNPMVVEGQVAGGAAQGIGMALLEELIYDDQAQLATATLMDYLYPTSAEVPDMSFRHIETPAAFSASGVKGAGEGGSIGGSGAVAQAVADAISPFGGRIARTPLTPERVLSLIDPTLEAS